MKKGLQKFTKEYLDECKKLSPEEILQFLENYKHLYYQASQPQKTKLISIKIPQNLLDAFRLRAKTEGIPYQTQIKKLMQDWVLGVKSE